MIYVADDSPTADVFEPKYLQCVYFNLYDDNNDPITFTVDMTLLVLEGKVYQIQSTSQWAFDAKMTSYQRRCDVVTSMRRNHVALTLIRRHFTSCAHWVPKFTKYSQLPTSRRWCSSKTTDIGPRKFTLIYQ